MTQPMNDDDRDDDDDDYYYYYRYSDNENQRSLDLLNECGNHSFDS